MRGMLRERLASGQLTLIRPDPGEAIETLLQMLTLSAHLLSEHCRRSSCRSVKSSRMVTQGKRCMRRFCR